MDVVLDAGDRGVKTFDTLLEKTARELERRAGLDTAPNPFSLHPATRLPPGDSERALETGWDLARRGIATFCPDAPTSGWPGLRRSRARPAPGRGPDPDCSDRRLAKTLPLEAGGVSHDALVYLREAAAAFYMDCLLSAAVLLALAAEGEFLRLLAAAKASAAWGGRFRRIGDGQTLAAKIAQFRTAMAEIRAGLPEAATEDLDANLEAIQSVIRAARDESGKPLGARPPSRDQVYLHLTLFIPFARQAARLRRDFNERPGARLLRLR
ncbi:hypothetical protein [Roseiarcus fermentans]|uniref:hypothetical protein n=1 Tax=Roseiarcus fermentans TaxID=1473586 RepID=UPI0011BF600E|nr:hypothetical protein [Roseiarcus fermentans]